VTRYELDTVELWNEPTFQFNGTNEQYVTMINAGYAGAHSVKSNITCVVAFGGGSTVDIGSWGEKFDLTDLYNLGLKWDALAIHPYCFNQDPDIYSSLKSPQSGIINDINYLLTKLGDIGKEDTPLYVTEFGFQSDVVGLDVQARWTVRQAEIMKTVPTIKVVMYYCFWLPEENTHYGFTLVYDDVTLFPKPVFTAYQDFITA